MERMLRALDLLDAVCVAIRLNWIGRGGRITITVFLALLSAALRVGTELLRPSITLGWGIMLVWVMLIGRILRTGNLRRTA